MSAHRRFSYVTSCWTGGFNLARLHNINTLYNSSFSTNLLLKIWTCNLISSPVIFSLQHLFFHPAPPNLVTSWQNTQVPQSSLTQPEQLAHIFLVWMHIVIVTYIISIITCKLFTASAESLCFWNGLLLVNAYIQNQSRVLKTIRILYQASLLTFALVGMYGIK